MHTRIKRIRGTGFRTFAGDFEFEFPESGTLLIEGRNTLTSGSSGAGKSNLFLAIAYVLGYCPYPATVLKSWHTDEPMWVELTLDTCIGEVIVRRGAKLTMTIAGKTVIGGAKAIEEKLGQVLGLETEMLAALTYRGQRKPGLFLRKTDSEKKEFLSSVLGLDRFEVEAEKASKKANDLRSYVEARGSLVQELEKQVEQAKTTLLDEEKIQELREKGASIGSTIESLSSLIVLGTAQVLKLKQQQSLEAESAYTKASAKGVEIEQQISQLKLIKSPETEKSEKEIKNDELLQECERRLHALSSVNASKKAQYQSALEDMRRRREAMLRNCALETEIRGGIESLQNENRKLEAGLCPTCNRTWAENEMKKQANLQTIDELRGKLLQIEADKENVKALQSQILEHGTFVDDPMLEKLGAVQHQLELQAATLKQQRLSELQNLVAIRQRDIEALQSELNLIKATAVNAKMEVVARFEQEIANVRKDELTHTVNLGVCRSQLSAIMAELATSRANTSSYAGLVDTLQGHRTQYETTKQQMSAEQEFARLVGKEGFLGLVFDQILTEIADETNSILGTVANTQGVSIEFVSEVTTQKGTVRREIRPILHIGDRDASIFLAEGVPDCAGVSGGMISTIELAVDLAVGRVVSHRAGVVPGWLILDESFVGLDGPSMEACMSILQDYGRERLVLVIDHASEFKALFSHSITIAYDNNGSKIVG